MSDTAAKSSAAALEADKVSIAVVDPSDADAPAYAMFALGRLDETGAFLQGAIFFERGEELSLEVSGDGRAPVRVRARVLSCTPGSDPSVDETGVTEATGPAGMTVEFCDLSSASKRALRLFIST